MPARLGLLMFLLYAGPGAFLPLFSLRLHELGFTPVEIGWACSTQALAGLFAPLLVGQIADRWLTPERCLLACAATASGILWGMANLTRPGEMIVASLALWFVFAPALTLAVAFSFAQLEAPDRQFGAVRLWGTVGWVAASWLLGAWLQLPTWIGVSPLWSLLPRPALADAFRIGAVFAGALALYALTLPPSPPRLPSTATIVAVEAVRLLSRPGFLVYFLSSLLFCVSVPFGAQLTPLLLDQLGVEPAWVGPMLTIGQAAEVASLAVLPRLLGVLGMKGTMVLGLAAWAANLIVQVGPLPVAAIGVGLCGHGIGISCFLVCGQLFIHRLAEGQIRVSAQAILAFANGMGMLLGNLMVGAIRQEMSGQLRETLAIGAALAAGVTIAFGLRFPREPFGEVASDAAAAQSAKGGSRPGGTAGE